VEKDLPEVIKKFQEFPRELDELKNNLGPEFKELSLKEKGSALSSINDNRKKL